MSLTIEDCVPVHVLDVARRLHVCEELLARTREVPGAADLTVHVEQALGLHLAALEREAEWQLANQTGGRHADGAVPLHKLVSRTVTSLADALDWMEAAGGPSAAAHARVVRAAALPLGVAAVTKQVYVGVYATVKALLVRLAAPELAPAAAEPAITQCLDRLAALNTAFGGTLTRPRMTHAAVRAANGAAFEAYVVLYARIVGRFPTNGEADTEARTRLLAPVFAARAEAADHRRRARARDEEDADGGERSPPAGEG